MLPEGFRWAKRHQYDTQDTALVLDGTQVAMLLARLDGSWFVRLWAHWSIREPLVTRPCTSLDAGRAGIETWACRHEAQIRDEVARQVWRAG
ncbi:MAG: hypothetical protein ACREO4_16295 [Lysobacter sp.]